MRNHFPLIILTTFLWGSASFAQSTTPDTLRIVVSATPKQFAPDVIVVPPHVSETAIVRLGMSPNQSLPSGSDAAHSRVAEAAAQANILRSVKGPWHIKVTFEEFDRDGKPVNSGTFEERWMSENQDVQIFDSEHLKQTDYATSQGTFRDGDQAWPNPTETQIRLLVENPFAGVEPLDKFRFASQPQNYAGHVLDCAAVLARFGDYSSPSLYCFLPQSNVVRYRQGPSWDQVVYNDATNFHGIPVARNVELTEGEVPRLKLKVVALDSDAMDETLFQLPSTAHKLGDDVLTGVQLKLVHMEPPVWPSSANEDTFTVNVELIVGTDGRVESAHAVKGPKSYYKSAERAAAKWTFQPYLLQGKPVKVKTTIELMQVQ